jgi:hypothetical protein
MCVNIAMQMLRDMQEVTMCSSELALKVKEYRASSVALDCPASQMEHVTTHGNTTKNGFRPAEHLHGMLSNLFRTTMIQSAMLVLAMSYSTDPSLCTCLRLPCTSPTYMYLMCLQKYLPAVGPASVHQTEQRLGIPMAV